MLDTETGVSAARWIANLAMLAVGLDPYDWHTRDKLIVAISPPLDGMLDYVQAVVATERDGANALALICSDRLKEMTAERDALLENPQSERVVHRAAFDAVSAERDELKRQLSVALKGKRPYSSKFADDTIAAQAKRIAELEEKLNGWFAERAAILKQKAPVSRGTGA
jgi:hypothetical protein